MVQILIDSHFDLVSVLLALDATIVVSQTVAQMAVGYQNPVSARLVAKCQNLIPARSVAIF